MFINVIYTQDNEYDGLQCESKNQYTRLLIITSANVDQFTKFIHR